MTSLLGPRLIVPILGVLILLTAAALLLPGRAEAGLRVQARVNTPHVQVRVANAPDFHHVERYRNPYRVHRTKIDLKIARKLAKRTRYGKGIFLDLRSAGYSWRKIGRILHINPRLVRRTVASVEDRYGYSSRHPNSRHNRGGKYKGYGEWDND
jgi:hypothetical protein